MIGDPDVFTIKSLAKTDPQDQQGPATAKAATPATEQREAADGGAATPATTATHRAGQGTDVADVATVAVAASLDIHNSITRAVVRRQARVEADLRENPERNIAWDVADAPLHPGTGASVSVVIAVRTGVGIVSGELRIPRERFDAALFLQTLTQTAETPA
jgi:hypothetical protein